MLTGNLARSNAAAHEYRALAPAAPPMKRICAGLTPKPGIGRPRLAGAAETNLAVDEFELCRGWSSLLTVERTGPRTRLSALVLAPDVVDHVRDRFLVAWFARQ